MSVIPALVLRSLTVRLPLGQKLIHQSYEPRIVRWFEQMNHLVDDDIFKAFDRLSGEISIQPKGACPFIAATPFRLHSLNEESLHSNAQQTLPFLIKGEADCRSCSRCHPSTSACCFALSVPGRT